MRLSQSCPKCHGTELLHVSQVTDLAEGNRPLPWALVTQVEGKHSVPYGKVEAYVCKHCGLTEFYTAGAAEIPVDGVVIKDISGKSGPFR